MYAENITIPKIPITQKITLKRSHMLYLIKLKIVKTYYKVKKNC